MVVFTQPASRDSLFDIESRVFDPVEDIPEDPVVRSPPLFPLFRIVVEMISSVPDGFSTLHASSLLARYSIRSQSPPFNTQESSR